MYDANFMHELLCKVMEISSDFFHTAATHKLKIAVACLTTFHENHEEIRIFVVKVNTETR